VANGYASGSRLGRRAARRPAANAQPGIEPDPKQDGIASVEVHVGGRSTLFVTDC